MDYIRFFGRVATLPIAILKTIAQYYTVGTVYSRTNVEFTNSLYKNLHLAVEYHLAGAASPDVVKRFIYNPFEKFLARYKSHPMTVGLSNFGVKIDERSYWIADNKSDSVLLFLHGGGYLFNIFESQLAGILGVYHAIPEESRKKLSVVTVDYSLTCHGKKYPTQIHETLTTIKHLTNQGYKNIHIIGDSAGGNLGLSVSRFIAYPEDAQKQFSQFPEFNFDFGTLPQPKSLILISPWVEPLANAVMPQSYGVSFEGDLGSPDGKLGKFYVEGLDFNGLNIKDWVTFTDSDFEKHWSKVDAINEGNTLVIYGEREVLRYGIENFVDIINKRSNIQIELEKGGIHDGLFYVESLDFMSKHGGKKALEGAIKEKFGCMLVGQFLSQRL